MDTYRRWRKAHFVTIRQGNFVGITERGEEFCRSVITTMISSLPPKIRQQLTANVVTENSLYQSLPFGGQVKIQETIKLKNSLLSLEEYCKRTDIEPVLKYKKFFGRQQELNELYDFLQTSGKKITIILDGGVGNTRLILQFAMQVQNHKEKETGWDVCFIHPYENFQIQPDRKTLLILDDAVRYQDLDKLVDFVLNSSGNIEVRLLITAMSNFKNLIINHVMEKNYEPAVINLGRGDIVSFLQHNFPWIDEQIASQIESQCKNNFVYAILCAEYWKEEGPSDELKKILSWKMERYIRNMAEKTGCSIEDVTYVIDLISLVMPLDWIADKQYLKKTLSNQKYCALENILQETSTDLYEDSLFLSQVDSKVAIKPDPLADFLRLHSFENPKMQLILKQLIEHMPYRISFNAIAAWRFDEEKDLSKLLVMIWEELNSKGSFNPEYVFALYTFVDSIIPFFPMELKKSKVSKWLEAFEVISRNYPALKLRMAFTISNTCELCITYGTVEQTEEEA